MKKRSSCPLSCALEIIGDKWSLLILRDILFFKKKYFKDFIGSKEKIATNILTDRLNLLVREGLLQKKKDPYNKLKNIYTATPKGIGLEPVLLAIGMWGDKHIPQTLSLSKLIEKQSQ